VNGGNREVKQVAFQDNFVHLHPPNNSTSKLNDWTLLRIKKKKMVTYLDSGNIFNLPDVKNYAHGCNCAGAMGKGIALQFKEKYNQMYLEYKKRCKDGDFSLGDVFSYDYGEGTVFNLGTQKTWKTKAELKAIEDSLLKMLVYARQNGIEKIALPKIGAGLGGLVWDDVKATINRVAKDYDDIDLIVVENYRNI
jgi:O-acetyl-ADP-ribose deacetylase (regulator of RNase III)